MSDSESIISDDEVAPDLILKEVQKMRLGLIRNKESVENADPKLLAVLRDLADTAVNEKKLKVDETTSATNGTLALELVKIISGINGNPFENNNPNNARQKTISPPDLGEIKVLPGQDSRGIINIDYDECFSAS